MNTQAPHPWEYIQEEMNKREWGIEELAKRIGGNLEVEVLTWLLYAQGRFDENVNVTLGQSGALSLSKAFGVSPELFTSLEKEYLKNKEAQ